MYAPLALKFVFDGHQFIEVLTYLVLTGRAPVVLTANTRTPSKSHSHTGVVAGSGVAALLAIGAIAFVVWRRRRRLRQQTLSHTHDGSPSLSEVIDQGEQFTVTPFNPTRPASLTVGQQLVHNPEDSPRALRREVSFPVGVSSKELARLRRLRGLRTQAVPIIGGSSDPLAGPQVRGAATVAALPSSEAQRRPSGDNVSGDETRIERPHGGRSELPPSYASRAAGIDNLGLT